MYWIYLVALLLAAAGASVLLALLNLHQGTAKRRFDDLFAPDKDGTAWLTQLFSRSVQAGETSRETQQREHALLQAGWTRRQQRLYFRIFTIASPAIGLLAGVVFALFKGGAADKIALFAFVGFALGYLLPPRVLQWQIKRRQKAVGEEMLAVLHLLRMLFDSGLSLEHAMRVISEQGKELVPHMGAELGKALKRINAGQERGEALSEMAAPLNVAELNDTIAILKQSMRYGGNLNESLTRFAQLTQDRRMAELREYVSKLSAKMTLVMVLFMFPALMLFLAGPGFLALSKALGNM